MTVCAACDALAAEVARHQHLVAALGLEADDEHGRHTAERRASRTRLRLAADADELVHASASAETLANAYQADVDAGLIDPKEVSTMRTDNEDKAMDMRPELGREAWIADVAAHDERAQARRTPAEKAGDITPEEQARLDEALKAWSDARETASALGRQRLALTRELERGQQMVVGRWGATSTAMSPAESAALRARIRDAEQGLRDANEAAQAAQRACNRASFEIGRACTARRAAAHRELDFQAYLDRQRAKGERVDERETRRWWFRGGKGEGFRVRTDGAVQGDIEVLPAVGR